MGLQCSGGKQFEEHPHSPIKTLAGGCKRSQVDLVTAAWSTHTPAVAVQPGSPGVQLLPAGDGPPTDAGTAAGPAGAETCCSRRPATATAASGAAPTLQVVPRWESLLQFPSRDAVLKAADRSPAACALHRHCSYHRQPQPQHEGSQGLHYRVGQLMEAAPRWHSWT